MAALTPIRFIPDVGFHYSNHGVSLIASALMIGKRNARFSNSQLVAEAAAILKYTEAVTNATPSALKGDRILEELTFREYQGKDFYKYVTDDAANFIREGSFKLGSTEHYRTIESAGRDEREGLSFVAVKALRRWISAQTIGGFNSYVLCGTPRADKTGYMEQKFGRNIVRITDIRKFGERVADLIGARSVHIHRVRYADHKLLKCRAKLNNLKSLGPHLNEEFFDILVKHSFLPAIFVKPRRFSREKELRLAFAFENDVPFATRTVADRSLADLVDLRTGVLTGTAGPRARTGNRLVITPWREHRLDESPPTFPCHIPPPLHRTCLLTPALAFASRACSSAWRPAAGSESKSPISSTISATAASPR